MQLNYQKELTPVIFGKSGIKVFEFNNISKNTMCFSEHWHDRVEIIFVKSGSVHFNISKKKYEVLSGEGVLINPCQAHLGVSGNDGASYLCVMFDLENFTSKSIVCDCFITPVLSQKIIFEPVIKNKEILNCVEEIAELEKSDKNYNSVFITSEIYKLIGLFYTHLQYENNDYFSHNSSFDGILEFINNNFLKEISSKELSAYFGYDESYFCRKFKKITGLSPVKYIKIMRLENSQKLISDGSSISEAASKSGFTDTNYFSRCFKAHFGITASEFGKKAP